MVEVDNVVDFFLIVLELGLVKAGDVMAGFVVVVVTLVDVSVDEVESFCRLSRCLAGLRRFYRDGGIGWFASGFHSRCKAAQRAS